jgi:hypothetical protein
VIVENVTKGEIRCELLKEDTHSNKVRSTKNLFLERITEFSLILATPELFPEINKLAWIFLCKGQ